MEGYGYDGINISRQVMAGWMIKLHQYYFEPVHRMMKAELFALHLIHCDESPFKMTGEKEVGEAVKRIVAIYHTDNMYKGISSREILDNRQQSVKPLVETYFV